MGSSSSTPSVPARTAAVAPLKEPIAQKGEVNPAGENVVLTTADKPKVTLERDTEVHQHARNSDFHYQQMPRCRTCRQIQWDYEIAPHKIHGFTGHKRGQSPTFDEFGRKKKGTKGGVELHEEADDHPMAGVRTGNALLPAKSGVKVGQGGQHRNWVSPSDALGYDSEKDASWRRERLNIFPDETGFPGFGRYKPTREHSAPPAPRIRNSEFAAINDIFSPVDIKVTEEQKKKQHHANKQKKKKRRHKDFREDTDGADEFLQWLKNGKDNDEDRAQEILFTNTSQSQPTFVGKNRRRKDTEDLEEDMDMRVENLDAADYIPAKGVLKSQHPRLLSQEEKEEILRQARLKEGETCWDCGQVVWFENMVAEDDEDS